MVLNWDSGRWCNFSKFTRLASEQLSWVWGPPGPALFTAFHLVLLVRGSGSLVSKLLECTWNFYCAAFWVNRYRKVLLDNCHVKESRGCEQAGWCSLVLKDSALPSDRYREGWLERELCCMLNPLPCDVLILVVEVIDLQHVMFHQVTTDVFPGNLLTQPPSNFQGHISACSKPQFLLKRLLRLGICLSLLSLLCSFPKFWLGSGAVPSRQ